MRALLRLTLPLLIAALAVAEEKETAPLPAGKTALTEKKSCPLCKLPGRAALFAGNAKAGKCITDCADLCCKGAELVLLLEGIANKDGARRVIAALDGLKEVKVKGVLADTGRTILNYNTKQLTAAQVRGILERAGLKVVGELYTFKIAGLEKPGAAEVLVEALASTTGVSAIDTVCQSTGQAIIEYDPAKTSPRRLAAVLNSTPCKVALP